MPVTPHFTDLVNGHCLNMTMGYAFDPIIAKNLIARMWYARPHMLLSPCQGTSVNHQERVPVLHRVDLIVYDTRLFLELILSDRQGGCAQETE